MNKLNIVADENIPLLQEFFGELGRIRTYPGRSICAAQVRDADVLLVRSVTAVGAELLDHSAVQFVGTCTIGTDHLDVDYLQRRAISWSSAPGCNARSVVEYVLSALARVKPDWLDAEFGIVGCGNVGGLLYRQLRALGLPCKCYDPLLTGQQNPDLASLEQVLATPVICLHAPLTTTGPYPSWHLLDAQVLQQLRPGTVLISAGRGGVIDNQALKKVLQRRRDLTVVLDVWEPEPGIDIDLLQLVDLGSPHIAGYSFDGKVAGTALIYQALCRHLGRQPEITVEQLANPQQGALGEIKLPSGDRQTLLNSAIIAAYDICEDDHNLRQLLSMTTGRPEYFDQLRKNYRQRREFSHYPVSGLPATTEGAAVARDLALLGFPVVHPQ